MGIKSALNIPLFIGQRVHHLFAVNSMKVERNWPDELITHMRLLGEIFVSALQRRETDQILNRTKERLDLAADSAEAVFWELDLESGSLWANDKAFELFSFAPQVPLTLTRHLEKVHAEDHEQILQAIDRTQRTGSELSVEYRAPRANGQDRWMLSRGRLVRPSESSFSSRLMGITMEVTKHKAMEQQLKLQVEEISHLREQLENENAYLRIEAANRRDHLSTNDGLQTVMSMVAQVAPTGSTVLIEGETGTGKELIAEAIHRQSERGKRTMIKVNCAALPAALVESELFGREKGAFTGALSRQAGRFELADGSTLFLDEIAEMPLETQAKLLRFLQEGEFERLGSPKTIKVDVRIIAATNRDLAAEVEQGRFRRDLFYRLNVFPIHLPPLRERPEDIPRLVWEFVNEFGARMGKKIRRIANRDMEQLKNYSWPGNIRELRNIIEHALIVSNGETLELQLMTLEDASNGTPVSLEEVERRHIQRVLKSTRGRVKGTGGAAELLGLNPSTLYSRMRKLGIHPVHA
jgi:transcriptional regulator with PAS, ATPase and Fis domain